MKKSKFTEAQILSIIEEYNQGKKVTQICRERGIAISTFYHWRSTFTGNELDQLTLAKQVEARLVDSNKEPVNDAVTITILKDLN